MSNKLEQVAVADIAPSALNPRKRFEKPDLDELAASLLQDGVLQPLVVRPQADAPDGDGLRAIGQPRSSKPYELIAGERRWRAARRAGLRTVPAVVRTDLDDVAVLRLMFVENVQRAQLRPIEEADACQAMLDADPQTDMAALAKLVGRSSSWVYQRLQLRKLTPGCRASVTAGRLSAGHATEIARLQPDDQERALRECDFAAREEEDAAFDWENELSLRGLERWIKNHIPISRRNPERAAKGVPILLDPHFPTHALVDTAERKKILLKPQFVLVGKAEKSCKHTIDGVVFLGPYAGDVRRICPRKSRCRRHWGRYFEGVKQEREQAAEREAEYRRRDAEREHLEAERERAKAEIAPLIEAGLKHPPAFTPYRARQAMRMIYADLSWRVADGAAEVEEQARRDEDWWPLLLRAAVSCAGTWRPDHLAERAVALGLIDPIEAYSTDLTGGEEAETDAARARIRRELRAAANNPIKDEDVEPRADACTAAAGDGA